MIFVLRAIMVSLGILRDSVQGSLSVIAGAGMVARESAFVSLAENLWAAGTVCSRCV